MDRPEKRPLRREEKSGGTAVPRGVSALPRGPPVVSSEAAELARRLRTPHVEGHMCAGALFFRPPIKGDKATYICFGMPALSRMSEKEHKRALEEMEDDDHHNVKYSLHMGMSIYTNEMQNEGKPPIMYRGATIQVRNVGDNAGQPQERGGTSANHDSSLHHSPISSSSSRTLPDKGSLAEIVEEYHTLVDDPSPLRARQLGTLIKERFVRDNVKFYRRFREGLTEYYDGFPGNYKKSCTRALAAAEKGVGQLQEAAHEYWKSLRK